MAEIVTSVLEGAERAAARAMAMGRVAGGEKCRDERWCRHGGSTRERSAVVEVWVAATFLR